MLDDESSCIVCGAETAELECETCGEPVCTNCVMDAFGGYYCPPCWNDVMENATIDSDQKREKGE